MEVTSRTPGNTGFPSIDGAVDQRFEPEPHHAYPDAYGGHGYAGDTGFPSVDGAVDQRFEPEPHHAYPDAYGGHGYAGDTEHKNVDYTREHQQLAEREKVPISALDRYIRGGTLRVDGKEVSMREFMDVFKNGWLSGQYSSAVLDYFVREISERSRQLVGELKNAELSPNMVATKVFELGQDLDKLTDFIYSLKDCGYDFKDMTIDHIKTQFGSDFSTDLRIIELSHRIPVTMGIPKDFAGKVDSDIYSARRGMACTVFDAMFREFESYRGDSLGHRSENKKVNWESHVYGKYYDPTVKNWYLSVGGKGPDGIVPPSPATQELNSIMEKNGYTLPTIENDRFVYAQPVKTDNIDIGYNR